jgi:hypothetical protein
VFRDLDPPAPFTLFDISAEFQTAPGCPFMEKSGMTYLAEPASAIRIGHDRGRRIRSIVREGRLLVVALNGAFEESDVGLWVNCGFLHRPRCIRPTRSQPKCS